MKFRTFRLSSSVEWNTSVDAILRMCEWLQNCFVCRMAEKFEGRGRYLTEFQLGICPEDLRNFIWNIWWSNRDSIQAHSEYIYSPTAIQVCPVNSKESAHNVLISTERLGTLLLLWDILSSTFDTEVDYPEFHCCIRQSTHACSCYCIVARTERGGAVHLPAVTRSSFWDQWFWGLRRPMFFQILRDCSRMTTQE
jgi:hypothetical protein